MTERRADHYSFKSERELTAFFGHSLPVSRVREIIERQRAAFVARAGSDARERKIEFLRKCEWELVRVMRETLTSPGDT